MLLMKKLHSAWQVLGNDRLFKNILKLEGEVGRLEFFTILLLRFTLLFVIAQVKRHPALLLGNSLQNWHSVGSINWDRSYIWSGHTIRPAMKIYFCPAFPTAYVTSGK
jgi:hypothetical protein